MSHRLRLVVYTSGELSPVNRVFFERIARDPSLDVAGIVVDDYRRPPRPLTTRIVRGLREDGVTFLVFKLVSTVEKLANRVAITFWERTHSRVGPDESYEAFQEATGVPVYRVGDIHAVSSLTLIRSLRPTLGLIVGGRILRDSVLRIPELGTLNIHKRKVPDYRGGGPVGYWEVLASERSIGVTIHWAVAQVDAGDVMGQIEIPIEECDTLESLRIKADVAGARLYHDVVRAIAGGRRGGASQDLTRGRAYRAPSDTKVWRLERRLRRQAVERMPALWGQPSWLVRTRLLAEYLVVRPRLFSIRRRLVEGARAPIAVFFHHVVSNRVVNHLGMPLERFVGQVEFLRRYFELASLDEAVERLRSGKNERMAVVLTFDDGYRDNAWAIEYLSFFGIPAAFFVSAGHVHDGTPFAHDRDSGFTDASPMRVEDVRALAAAGFTVGSHALHHEDFARLDEGSMERVLRESRQLVGAISGTPPEHFSFPIGERDRQVTRESVDRALRHYRYVHSAYGGYNLPDADCRHFLRIPAPPDLLSLATVVDGYTGFRACLRGDGWALRTGHALGEGEKCCTVQAGTRAT
jgi:peptidoglycan/xylan/chitin deacetylase (PgdA/CDA1 family)